MDFLEFQRDIFEALSARPGESGSEWVELARAGRLWTAPDAINPYGWLMEKRKCKLNCNVCSRPSGFMLIEGNDEI
jgi:hypothetical protein